jgi:hypothetical protein
MSAATRSAAGLGVPISALTRRSRAALTERFQRSTDGKVTHDVMPCGTPQEPPGVWPMASAFAFRLALRTIHPATNVTSLFGATVLFDSERLRYRTQHLG